MAVVACHAGVPGCISAARVGVQAFFVLSGYLITGMIADRTAGGAWRYRSFLGARMRRLMPPLVVMLAAVTLAGLVFDGRDAEALAAWSLIAATYLTDVARLAGAGSPVVGHTWTLAVEMQFYLVWPFVLAPILRTSAPGLVLAIIAGGLACLWPFSPPVLVEINPAPLVIGGALAFVKLPVPPAIARVLAWGPLPTIGLLSYGIYLWHLPIA